MLGVLLAVLVEKGWRPRLPFVPCVALLLVVAGIVSVGLGNHPQSVVDVVLAPLFALVILSAALADLGGRRGILRHRAFIYLGEVSFGFYLVHELVIVNLGSAPAHRDPRRPRGLAGGDRGRGTGFGDGAPPPRRAAVPGRRTPLVGAPAYPIGCSTDFHEDLRGTRRRT